MAPVKSLIDPFETFLDPGPPVQHDFNQRRTAIIIEQRLLRPAIVRVSFSEPNGLERHRVVFISLAFAKRTPLATRNGAEQRLGYKAKFGLKQHQRKSKEIGD